MDSEASAREFDVVDEFDTCDLSPGDRIFAAGWGPAGAKMWYLARVTRVCATKWPPVTVHFESTLEGGTHALELPTARQTALHARDLMAVLYCGGGARLTVEEVAARVKTG